MFDKHQQQDKVLQSTIKKELKQHHNGTTYTTKEVEGVYLIHKNNKIIVLPTLQERVMKWYHMILLHPGRNIRKKVSAPSIHGTACKLILSAIIKRVIPANAARDHARNSMDSYLKRKER